jgi:predicted transposase/invertase (TIGR01784 family)
MQEEKTYLYYKATGPLKYNMTNDYLFRMVLQKDPETLIRLICSLLHLERDQVIEAHIDNPVTPGEAISDKEYQLDIIVSLNGNITINLEMQVINYKNWTARSLSYLCRKFDSVARGDDYNNANIVYQIGFLDFTLFENHPEFLAKYQMRNAKDNFLYTDKFNLYVLELNHTGMATSEDKLYSIDIWARLFKAKTWEEIKMITKDNPSMNSTAETIFMSTANEKILEQCRIREDNIAHEKYQNDLIKALTSDNKSLTDENRSLSDENRSLSDENKSLSDENKSLFDENLRLIKLLEENGIKP